MLRAFSLLVLSMVGCDGRLASVETPAELEAAYDPAERHQLARVDVRGTAKSAELLLAEVRALSPQRRHDAVASLDMLSTHCAYTRVSLQMPFALSRVVDDIAPERLDPLVRQDWVHLQQGLSTHVAVLEALGVDLAAPVTGDHLHGREAGLMVDRATLARVEDPILVTFALVDAVTDLAESAGPETRARIEMHSGRVEAATGIVRMCPRGPWAVVPGHPWTLGELMGGWQDALRRIRPFVDDSEVAARVDAMVEILQALDDVNGL